MTSNKSFSLVCLWVLLITVLSYLYAYPFDIFSRGAHLGKADPSLALWIFDWQLSHLSSGNLTELFTGNMFYPLDHSVVFSINMLSTVILNIPLFWLTGNPELSFTASIHFSFILCALGMFVLARRLKLDIPSAIAASFIFSFSEFRLYFTSHLSLLTMQWMPFTLLFIHKYIDEGRKTHLYWAALFFCMQITASAHYAIFFSIIVLAFAGVLCLQQQITSWKKLFGDAVGPAILTLAVGAACYYPYLKVSHNFGFSRPFGEQIRYGADVEVYLSAAHSYFLGPLTADFGHIEGYASPRFTALFLTAAAMILYRIPVARLTFISKFDLVLVALAVLSFFTWKSQTTWIPVCVSKFPFTENWDSLVWQLIILTPISWLALIRLGLTDMVRSIVSGLRGQKVFFLYFVIGFLAFLISLGPAMKVNGFAFALNPVITLLFFVFPGFDSIRAISRISGLVPLGLSITSGLALMLIAQRLKKAYLKNLFYIIFIGLLLFEIFPGKGVNPPYKKDEPSNPEYAWLKGQAGAGPVLEWPIHSPFDGEALYVERSLIHKKPMVNGFGSYQWRGHKKLSKMKNLSQPETLLSLYAFGVRYLLVHKVGGEFPKWATGKIGQFEMSRKFENTLVYENNNAGTQFLPDNYWKKFNLLIARKGKDRCKLVLGFESPDNYYVSKIRNAMKVRFEGEESRLIKEKELILYPDLWRDGDKIKMRLDEESCSAKQIFFLIDGNKHEVQFTTIDLENPPV